MNDNKGVTLGCLFPFALFTIGVASMGIFLASSAIFYNYVGGDFFSDISFGSEPKEELIILEKTKKRSSEDYFSNKEELASKIATDGWKIKVRYSKESMPYSYEKSGKPAGSEVVIVRNVIKEILEDNNIDADVDDVIEWSSVYSRNRFDTVMQSDVVIGAISSTPDRCDNNSSEFFCTEYIGKDTPKIVVKKDSRIDGFCSVFLKKMATISHTTGSQRGSPKDYGINDCPGFKYEKLGFTNRKEAMDAVYKGTVSGYATDSRIVSSYSKADEYQDRLEIVGVSPKIEKYVIFVNKKSNALYELIDNKLRGM